MEGREDERKESKGRTDGRNLTEGRKELKEGRK